MSRLEIEYDVQCVSWLQCCFWDVQLEWKCFRSADVNERSDGKYNHAPIKYFKTLFLPGAGGGGAAVLHVGR